MQINVQVILVKLCRDRKIKKLGAVQDFALYWAQNEFGEKIVSEFASSFMR